MTNKKDIDPEDISKIPPPNEKKDNGTDKVFYDDVSGDDLDVSGNEADEKEENAGSKDEGNKGTPTEI